MSTEVGSIYLSLNLKDNVQAQIGHLASKADTDRLLPALSGLETRRGKQLTELWLI